MDVLHDAIRSGRNANRRIGSDVCMCVQAYAAKCDELPTLSVSVCGSASCDHLLSCSRRKQATEALLQLPLQEVAEGAEAGNFPHRIDHWTSTSTVKEIGHEFLFSHPDILITVSNISRSTFARTSLKTCHFLFVP